MMDIDGLINESSQLLFEEKKYAEAIGKLYQALDGITDKNTQIFKQSLIQSGLICCYLEYAKKTKNTDKAEELFGQAIKCCREY